MATRLYFVGHFLLGFDTAGNAVDPPEKVMSLVTPGWEYDLVDGDDMRQVVLEGAAKGLRWHVGA